MYSWVVWGGLMPPVVALVGALADAGSNAGGTLDWTPILASFGVAGPFAAVCLLQMNRAQAKVEKLEAKVDDLQAAALQRERENVARLSPIVYDSALLYKQGNEYASKVLDQADHVAVAEPSISEVNNKLDVVLAQLESRGTSGS